METGTMLMAVSLAGQAGGMKLAKGQRVSLVRAKNLPSESLFYWYASPLDGVWSDGIVRHADDSIAIHASDVQVDFLS